MVYRGTRYKGNHPAIVPAEVWYQVQSVLTAHECAVEATQVHGHYLKGTIHCGQCGSRLIVSNAKNRHGNVYAYVVCSGRAATKTTCTRSAVPVQFAEHLAEDSYATITISESDYQAPTAEFDTAFDQKLANHTDHHAGGRALLHDSLSLLTDAHHMYTPPPCQPVTPNSSALGI